MSLEIKKKFLPRYLFSIKNSIVSICVIACVGITVFAAISLSQSYILHKKEAETSVRNLCSVLSDNLIYSYQKIDIAVLGVKNEVERQIDSGGVNGPRLEEFIMNRMKWISVLYALRTANAEGIIEHGNEVVKGSRISIADRDYFIHCKSDPGAGLVFSKPLVSRITGKWAVILARRINRKDGSFAGVAYGSIELDKVKSYFDSLTIGNDGIITLRDRNLGVILRRGNMPDVTGQTAVSDEFRALVQAGHNSGTFTAVSKIDNIERIYSFIKMNPYDQYLYIGLANREVFAHWREEFYVTIFFAAMFILIIGTFSRITYNAWVGQQQAKTERESVIVKLEKSLEEVKLLSGLIPICSSCKKIRDDNGYWSQIESYISSHSEAEFSHSICPDCAKRLYPGLYEKIDKSRE